MITCKGPRADVSPCATNNSSRPEYVMGCVEDVLSDESCLNTVVLDSWSSSGSYVSSYFDNEVSS